MSTFFPPPIMFSFQYFIVKTPEHKEKLKELYIEHARPYHLSSTIVNSWLYVNRELPDVQAGFRKGRGIRDQIANICWMMEKAREFQIKIYFCFIDYAKAFDCVNHNRLWKILRDENTRPPDLPPEKSVCRSGSNS